MHTKSVRAYARPTVRTLSAQEMVQSMGPAHANHCYHEPVG